MQTRAEWTVRTNQPDPDGMCTKSGLDKRFPLFGGKTLLMIACGAGDATCVEMLLTGVTGRFMDPEGDNDGSFTMKSITMRSGIDEAVSAGRWPNRQFFSPQFSYMKFKSSSLKFLSSS